MNNNDQTKDSSYFWLKILGISSIMVACTLIISAGVMFIVAVYGHPCTSKNENIHRYVCKHHKQCGQPCTSKNENSHRCVCKHHKKNGSFCVLNSYLPSQGLKQYLLLNDSIISDFQTNEYLKCFYCDNFRVKQSFFNDSIINDSNIWKYPKNLSICCDNIKIEQLLSNDSILLDCKTKDVLKDFLISYDNIRMEQSLLNDKYETLISDVRQETNNNLDKINTWLAFWIGILAVFGVLAPIVAEYRFRIDNEKRWENLEEKVKRSLVEHKEQFEKIQKQADGTFNNHQKRLDEKQKQADETFDNQKKQLEEIQGQVDENINNYKSLIAATELESCVNSLTNSYSDRIITGMSERDRIIAYLLRQIHSSLLKFIKLNQNENPDKMGYKTHRSMLVRILISLFSSVQRMRSWDSFKYQNRLIEVIQDNIRQILKSLGQDENIHSEDIEDKMNTIANKIDELCKTIK